MPPHTPPRQHHDRSRPPPQPVDTVIIGSGPSALLLSYILSGHEPVPSASARHPDPVLQHKLAPLSSLFDADVPHLTSHFSASRFSYSTQALPVNTLLDTLLRPLGDTEPGLHRSCIAWRESGTRVEHLVLGSSPVPGGQWAENPVKASWDIGALSYAELLDLPGYGIADFLREQRTALERADGAASVHSGGQVLGLGLDAGGEPDPYYRPTRREVAGYLAAWPARVGIEAQIKTGETVAGVCRVPVHEGGGFEIRSHGIRCRHLVIATGTFSRLIEPRETLRPLLDLEPLPLPPSTPTSPLPLPSASVPSSSTLSPPPAIGPNDVHTSSETPLPLLIVGSGFSAADLILTHLPARPILHIYKWAPQTAPSPLRACHPQAYPEYAGVYRRMKHAALTSLGDDDATSPLPRRRRKSSAYFGDAAAAAAMEARYEGLPNTWIQATATRGLDDGSLVGVVTLQLPSGEVVQREVVGMEYVIGRRGDMEYLDEGMRREVLLVDGHDNDSWSNGTDALARADSGYKAAQIPTTSTPTGSHISGRTLRAKIEDHGTQVARDVWVTGSLVGDSLIRHAYGSCVVAAGEIVRRQQQQQRSPEPEGKSETEQKHGSAPDAERGHAVPDQARNQDKPKPKLSSMRHAADKPGQTSLPIVSGPDSVPTPVPGEDGPEHHAKQTTTPPPPMAAAAAASRDDAGMEYRATNGHEGLGLWKSARRRLSSFSGPSPQSPRETTARVEEGEESRFSGCVAS